jgi:hypothetical protein
VTRTIPACREEFAEGLVIATAGCIICPALRCDGDTGELSGTLGCAQAALFGFILQTISGGIDEAVNNGVVVVIDCGGRGDGDTGELSGTLGCAQAALFGFILQTISGGIDEAVNNGVVVLLTLSAFVDVVN